MEINTTINLDKSKWSPEDIRCLISLYTDNVTSFDRHPKKKVWSDIAEKLSSIREKPVTGDQCDGKFKGLKTIYKKVKDHNNLSGNSHKKWEFYELMDELLNRRPEISPPATCASDEPETRVNRQSNPYGAGTSTSAASDFDFADIIEETNVASPPSSLQRKRQTADNNRMRRHAEKMAKTDQFLELFQKLIDKI